MKSNRQLAIQQGQKIYEGNPCKNCENTARRVSNACCINCEKAYKQSSEYKLYQKQYQKKPESKLYQKRFHQTPKSRTVQRAWRQSTKGKVIRQITWQNNRAKRLDAEGSYTTQEWIALKEQYGNRCLRCHKHQFELDRVLEQDHIIPITKGGTNWITNIQPLCHDCNGMGCKGTQTIDYRTLQEKYAKS